MEQSCVGADIHVQLSQAKCVGAAPVCPPERPRSGVSIPKIHALCAGNLTTDAPLWGDTGGHIGTAPTNLHHIFPRILHKQNNHLRAIHPNDTNRLRVIHPNETVGAVPVCPPERPRSGVSIPKIHALCAGDERWMRPCRATRAGTQAPPLPRSVIFFHTIPYKQNNHLRAILPNDINHPNETR